MPAEGIVEDGIGLSDGFSRGGAGDFRDRAYTGRVGYLDESIVDQVYDRECQGLVHV